MSEVIGWIIIVIVAAVILSWGVTIWRTRSASMTAADRISAFPRRHSLLLGFVAIILAGLAQFVLQAEQPEPALAAIGYGIAVFLFVSALRPFVPVTVVVDPSILTAGSSMESAQSQPGLAQPRSAFLQTLRYYTLDNILKGRSPVVPNSVTSETPLSLATGLTTSATVETLATTQPAAFRVWTGFDRPQSLCVTAQGNVIVLDGARQQVYCLNPLGQIIRAWSLPDIPDLQDCHVAISPDGKNLYLADPARGQIYSITLHEDRL